MAENNQLNKKILIVEDELPMLRVLLDEFSRAGFQVVTATNGRAGLDLAISERPDVILLDLLMPKMSGMEVLKNVRQEGEWGRKVPVVILTNLSPNDDKIVQGIAQDEPSYYLVKGESKIDDIIQKVKSCL